MLELLARPGVLEGTAAEDSTGMTILVKASRAGLSKAVSQLLQMGLDPNARGKHGTSPLQVGYIRPSIKTLDS